MQRTVQWQGDNTGEVEHFLSQFVVRADKCGDQCHIVGINGMNVVLELGDSVVLDKGKLGVIRHPKGMPIEDPEMTWAGDYMAAAKFLESYKVGLQLVGEDLHLFNSTARVPVHRGDKLILRDNHIVVSIEGRDHRN